MAELEDESTKVLKNNNKDNALLLFKESCCSRFIPILKKILFKGGKLIVKLPMKLQFLLKIQYRSKEVQFGEEKPFSRQCQCIYWIIYNQKTMLCAMHNSFAIMMVLLAEKDVSSSRSPEISSSYLEMEGQGTEGRDSLQLTEVLQFKFQLYPRILFS